MTLLDFTFPLASQIVFDKIVVRDWYDGPTSGIAKSSRLGTAFSFEILAWGPDQAERVFALSLLGAQAFDRIVVILKHRNAATWPLWLPDWPIWRSEETEQRAEIEELLEKAEDPQYVLASDSMFATLFAAQELDHSSRRHLPASFDGSPAADNFAYWKSLLCL